MLLRRLILRPLLAATLSSLLHAQIKPPEAKNGPPLLKLEVIPAKRTYRVGEAIVVKYKLTNLSDKTVCFPRPDTKTEDEAEGYIRTSAIGSEGESTAFIEGFYPRGITDQDLVNEANENWIKLAPGLSYVTQAARPLTGLAPGRWQLRSGYSAPYLRGRGKLILDALSCTPPEVGVTSKAVSVKITGDLGNQE